MDFHKHFKPIILLFVMILAQTIFNSSDITMLGLMCGDYEVGIYSTAVKITFLISQVMASILWVVMPRLSSYFAKNDYVSINYLLCNVLKVFLIVGIPCAIGTVCLSKEIITIIAGEDFIAASDSLNILMLSFIFNLLGSSFLGNLTLLPAKRESTFLVIFTISTLANIILNFMFIPYFGSIAASTTISYFLILLMSYLTKDKRIIISGMYRSVFTSVFGCFLII